MRHVILTIILLTTLSCGITNDLHSFCSCIGEPSTIALMKLRTNYEDFLKLNYQTKSFETGTDRFIEDLVSEATLKIDSNSFNTVMNELQSSGFLDEFEIYEFWNDIESKMVQTAGIPKSDGKYAECLKLVNNSDINDYLEIKSLAGDMHWTVMIDGFKDYKHKDNELVQLIFSFESFRTYMLDKTLHNKR
jgi:hypothetical protein